MGGKRVIFLLGLLVITITGSLKAQNLRYRVMWKGDSIGIVSATRYDSAEFNVYTIDSEVRFWLFGTKTIHYNYHTIYKQDTLISAFTRYTRNGNLKAESTIVLNGKGGYKVNVDGEHRLISEPDAIDHSITAIYHNEPNSLNGIFSERFGEVLNVKSSGPNHYFIEKPDGRQTEYFFENGICSKVVIDNLFTTFTFERSE